MNAYTIIVIIFGILILAILVLLYFINHVLVLKRKVEQSFLAVRSYLDERVLLLKNVEDFIQNNFEHEEVLLKKISEVETNISRIHDCNEGIIECKNSNTLIKELTNLNKTYPNLKNKKNYLELKEKLALNKERLDYAFASYDEGVKNYNNYLEKEFISKIGKIFHFPKYNYYKK